MGSCSADGFTCFPSEVITMWTRSSGHSESFTNVSPAIFLFPCLFPVPSDSIQSLRTDRTPQLFASFQKFSLYCLKSSHHLTTCHPGTPQPVNQLSSSIPDSGTSQESQNILSQSASQSSPQLSLTTLSQWTNPNLPFELKTLNLLLLFLSFTTQLQISLFFSSNYIPSLISDNLIELLSWNQVTFNVKSSSITHSSITSAVLEDISYSLCAISTCCCHEAVYMNCNDG